MELSTLHSLPSTSQSSAARCSSLPKRTKLSTLSTVSSTGFPCSFFKQSLSNKLVSPITRTVNSGKLLSATESSDRVVNVSKDDVDALVERISFGELCDQFECVSSPAVERTARQLARDIIELRENRRQLSCFAVSVKYKDPLRSFTGREKLKRPSWILNALVDPQVAITSMEMTDTSHLDIKYTLQGRFLGVGLVAGPLTLTVTSSYVINQISGQVIEQEDKWDFAGSSPLAVASFWPSRLAWTVVEVSRDLSERVAEVSRGFSEGRGQNDIYVDPTDPKKFFQESNPNSELYQTAFFVALLYLVVQFLKATI